LPDYPRLVGRLLGGLLHGIPLSPLCPHPADFGG